jgi:hypothetical protein
MPPPYAADSGSSQSHGMLTILTILVKVFSLYVEVIGDKPVDILPGHVFKRQPRYTGKKPL